MSNWIWVAIIAVSAVMGLWSLFGMPEPWNRHQRWSSLGMICLAGSFLVNPDRGAPSTVKTVLFWTLLAASIVLNVVDHFVGKQARAEWEARLVDPHITPSELKRRQRMVRLLGAATLVPGAVILLWHPTALFNQLTAILFVIMAGVTWHSASSLADDFTVRGVRIDAE